MEVKKIDKQKVKLIIGSILHDIGKVLYRSGDGRKHSISGDEFIKRLNIEDEEITNSLKYHHKGDLLKGKLEEDSLAYITYIADNIASMADRRDDEESDKFFERHTPLYSVFNLINNRQGKGRYEAKYLNHDKGINYPSEGQVDFNESYYKDIEHSIFDKLRNIEYEKEYVNSLLEILEAYLTYVPSSTNLKEVADISLYDHLKFTSAISSCIYDYMVENEGRDFTPLSRDEKLYYEKEMFYMYALDFSGIQNFIFNIVQEGALKSLRTRSFYLEVLLEVIIDDILDALELSRANLLYSGGGHAYLLLPNTEKSKEKVESIRYDINNWLIRYYNIDIYLAGGGTPCTARDFESQELGSYKEIYKRASKEISKDKLNRYDYNQILKLNRNDNKKHTRECKVCRRVELLQDDDICSICENISRFSYQVINAKFFSVEMDQYNTKKARLPLPFNRFLIGHIDVDSLKARMKDEEHYIRSYGKNESYTGYKMATKLWVGEYNYDSELSVHTEDSLGIERLAVLKADVDGLGEILINGFDESKASFSRSATFSRNMSIFFKYHINYILENGEYYLYSRDDKRRRAVIVYSGGDDVFLVGEWSDIIGISIDLNKALESFSLGTLTISAGLGIYPKSYPIKKMAEETGKLEEYAKENIYEIHSIITEKDSICLFEKNLVFSWKDFEEKVLGEKYSLLENYFMSIDERGKTFIYNILKLLKNVDEKINIARLAYLLGRLEPKNKKKKKEHEEFSRRIYRYARTKKDRKELIAAMYIYIYKSRER